MQLVRNRYPLQSLTTEASYTNHSANGGVCMGKPRPKSGKSGSPHHRSRAASESERAFLKQ